MTVKDLTIQEDDAYGLNMSDENKVYCLPNLKSKLKNANRRQDQYPLRLILLPSEEDEMFLAVHKWPAQCGRSVIDKCISFLFSS